MTSKSSLHRAQTTILFTLRHATRARYSELLKPTGLEGDVFKYHIRKLIKANYILKAEDGLYELTAEGKEFANTLNEKTGKNIEQPKASLLFVVTGEDNDTLYYLAHKRLREPFRDFWGLMSAPLLRGMTVQKVLQHELSKQTGLDAEFEIQGNFRVIDKKPNGDVLEDKLFLIACGTVDMMKAPHAWYGGESVWMTREELLSQDRLFPTTIDALTMINNDATFAEASYTYTQNEY